MSLLAQVADAAAHGAHAAQGGMQHSMGPYSVAAAVFPYASVGWLYVRRAVLRRRYRRLADELERAGLLAEPYLD